MSFQRHCAAMVWRILVPLCLPWLTGCVASQEIRINQPEPAVPVAADQATAAAVSIDITPPPGMPMGGYSVMANRGEGFRTRLKARVVYLNDGKGQALALVQTDLAAGSLLVHHQVASRVAKVTGLNPGDIVITGSHSHSAPVNFFHNDFYNKHMSSGQWLEPDFLAFITERISTGIEEAYQRQRPAQVATGVKQVYGINRNRSLSAYVLNDNIDGIDLNDPQAKFRAVNPNLYMVRVDAEGDDGRYYPLAAFSSFSVHATTLAVPVEVYNADLFAYAQKDLEWQMRSRHETPWPVVHAMTTGTQGDMAPALPDRGDNTFGHHDVNWREAEQLGRRLGRYAIDLFEQLGSELSPQLSLASAAREVDIRRNNRVGDVVLCQDAAVGNPVAAGAYERRTPWLAAVPLLKGGNVMSRRWWFNTDGCQGNKRHLGFSFLQPLLEPKDSFPHIVLFQLLRINDTAILPLPFEVTTEAGRRISQAVLKELEVDEQPVRHAWVTSTSNGYFGYSTTVEEYARQNYEGGHTLYGRHTTPYIRAQLQQLAADLRQQGSLQQLLPNWRYALKTNRFLPPSTPVEGQRQWLQQQQWTLADASHEQDYLSWQWQDVGPSHIDFHRPLAHVEVWRDGQWQRLYRQYVPVSDDGYDLEVRWLENAEQGMAHYQLRWYEPLAGGQYRLVIAARGNQAALISEPFSVRR
ncbi:neutral/alkaline non-lysosomal ceramidase N-terminal domain-containing protein [Bacterioplanes sanyensis]|uniref:neutral/alkaline non-lysosomal ceramidase N-terminal domain-containing protein n=1 Tax=Bacterioplanes sanyensis TaxID=1249553 RepID=UPI001679102D|nr:neutral/alkaline non-lysosomal ceramidase N-terminal domain-containing protein [Bacterioplanes sanyensis]